MLILALTCTILGVIVGEGAKWMVNSTALQKLLALIGGGALFTTGIFLLAHCLGAI